MNTHDNCCRQSGEAKLLQNVSNTHITIFHAAKLYVTHCKNDITPLQQLNMLQQLKSAQNKTQWRNNSDKISVLCPLELVSDALAHPNCSCIRCVRTVWMWLEEKVLTCAWIHNIQVFNNDWNLLKYYLSKFHCWNNLLVTILDLANLSCLLMLNYA